MARYVLDASVVLAWVLQENLERVDRFIDALVEGEDVLVGPRLLIPECTSVIHELSFHGRIEVNDVPRYIEDLLAMRIQTTDNAQQFRHAVQLAQQFGHAKAYDMQYLAAALAEGVELVTVDNGMRQAAINIKHPVRFLR